MGGGLRSSSDKLLQSNCAQLSRKAESGNAAPQPQEPLPPCGCRDKTRTQTLQLLNATECKGPLPTCNTPRGVQRHEQHAHTHRVPLETTSRITFCLGPGSAADLRPPARTPCNAWFGPRITEGRQLCRRRGPEQLCWSPGGPLSSLASFSRWDR